MVRWQCFHCLADVYPRDSAGICLKIFAYWTQIGFHQYLEIASFVLFGDSVLSSYGDFRRSGVSLDCCVHCRKHPETTIFQRKHLFL